MKTLFLIIFSLIAMYLIAIALLYFLQRNLLFHPMPWVDNTGREEIILDNQGLKLQGWILNRGRDKALIYFGGNAESISDNFHLFEQLFEDHTVYLIDYRGYGKSEGQPNEKGMFSDAMAIYDQVKPEHQSISLMGRSLGSGVAVYLAASRSIDKLVLITPYDSIAEVAQSHYPYFPARYLVKDRFESVRYAPDVKASVLILIAELDRVINPQHSEKLAQKFSSDQLSIEKILGAAHNNVSDFKQYRQSLSKFFDSSA